MRIHASILSRIIAHAKKDLPLEACGYLGEKDGIILTHYELQNMDASSEHFSFNPQEQFTVMKEARAQGYALSAVYHSHPKTPARPSQEDIALAYDSEIKYVIISLAHVQPVVKVFTIREGIVAEEEMEVVSDE